MTTGRKKKRTRRGISGTVYPRGRKWAYLIDLGPDALTGDRRRDSRSGFLTEDEAWEALAEANAKLRASTYTKNSPRTVQQFLDEWLAASKISVKPTTHSNYSSYAKYYVIPIIGGRKLQDVSTETINRLYTHLLENGRTGSDTNVTMYELWRAGVAAGREPTPRELASAAGITYSAGVRARQRFRAGRLPNARANGGLEPRSVQSIHIMLNRAFADAVTWKYIDANPVKHAARIRRSRREHNVWTPDQLRQFLATARSDRYFAMWMMFATTGIRRSEAAGALVKRLDLSARTLTVFETRVVAAGKAQTSDGKSERSRRMLALDERTAAELAARLRTLDAERAAFGDDYGGDGLLFCWPDGRPIHPDTITEQFNRLVDRAGLLPIRLHDVRHTYATMALRAGVNPKIVSERLGHATVAFTLDTYTDDVPELHHAAAEAVSSLFLESVTEEPATRPEDAERDEDDRS
ncbi:site-specific integrase [Pseudonocardia kunmingensis]|uniref:Site-specific recombinase XerD n=1 Tax=Pseudonocardia kunmingensis TaxID=630975 RepID=A0A543DP65_9PSEU|nr:site-specific integrase [Pseudonocardia kunmingensis]TQM11130.1 site-specific recombinase XerD [Pseudonocardia kunmingensis]